MQYLLWTVPAASANFQCIYSLSNLAVMAIPVSCHKGERLIEVLSIALFHEAFKNNMLQFSNCIFTKTVSVVRFLPTFMTDFYHKTVTVV